MTRWRYALAAVAALLLSAGDASAQAVDSVRWEAGGRRVFGGNGTPGLLGFSFAGAPAEEGWADHPVVRRIYEGSPADLAGLQPGDVILGVNGQDGRKEGLFRNRSPGTRYVLLVRRAGEEREITFVLGPAVASPASNPAPRSRP